MSTKQNPGRFNCYEAAYPDETIFTLLARDPAFPATVRFWIEERDRQGKAENEEDVSRIAGALADARAAETWRKANLDPLGDGVPTWRLPRQIDMAAGLAGDTSYHFGECENNYTMSEIAEIIQRHENLDPVRLPVSSLSEMVNEVCERIDEYTATASIGVPVAEFLASLRRDLLVGVLRGEEPVPPYEDWHQHHDGSDAAHLEWIHERLVKVYNENPNFDYMHRLRKIIGDLHEDQPVAEDPYKMVVDSIRDNKDTFKRHVGMHPSLGMPYQSTLKTLGEYMERHNQGETLDGLGEPLRGEYVDDDTGVIRTTIHGANETKGERVVIDSKPTDLAHAPEVAPHRFSTFVKGTTYAYARGLEVAPIHLPTALDAMALDGWDLVSLFGETDSKNVGFIFKRCAPPPMHVVNVTASPCPEFGRQQEP